jgi:hypothetical protein
MDAGGGCNQQEYETVSPGATAAAGCEEAVGPEQQQQQQQQQGEVTVGMLHPPQLKRSFSDPHGLCEILSSDSNGSSSNKATQQKQRATATAADAAAAAAAAAADAAATPLSLEVPTVAVRRCMLQTSTEKFGVNFGHSQVQVEVRSVGVYKFKGVAEPVPMVAVSTQRLAGRRFPAAAACSKVGGRGNVAVQCNFQMRFTLCVAVGLLPLANCCMSFIGAGGLMLLS